MSRLKISVDFLKIVWRDRSNFGLLVALVIALIIFFVSRSLPNVDSRVGGYFYSLFAVDFLLFFATPRREGKIRTIALLLMASLEIVMITYLILVTLLGGR